VLLGLQLAQRVHGRVGEQLVHLRVRLWVWKRTEKGSTYVMVIFWRFIQIFSENND
jgi:hypothetical protein